MKTLFQQAHKHSKAVAKVEGSRYPDMVALAELLGDIERSVMLVQEKQSQSKPVESELIILARKLKRIHLLANEFLPPTGCTTQYAQAIGAIRLLTEYLEQIFNITSTKEEP